MQCLVFNTKFDYSSYEKIGLDVVNLDFIFHVKCDHFLICHQRKARVLKEYPHETHYICKKDNEQKQLEVAIRDLQRQLQQEEKRTELEVK